MKVRLARVIWNGGWPALFTVGQVLAVELPPKAFSDLGSTDFHLRETAQGELLEWGRQQPEPAKDELLQQVKNSPDPEVRMRCLAILRDLVNDDYSKEGSGYMGIGLRGEIANVPGDPKPRSVIRVMQVQPDTPAKHAGIVVDDLIVGLDEEIWYEADAYATFQAKIKAMKPYTKVKLKILRKGELSDVDVLLMRRPVVADNPSSIPFRVDPEGPERASKEAYFREWLSGRNPPK